MLREKGYLLLFPICTAYRKEKQVPFALSFSLSGELTVLKGFREILTYCLEIDLPRIYYLQNLSDISLRWRSSRKRIDSLSELLKPLWHLNLK